MVFIKGSLNNLFHVIAKAFPMLKLKLKQAGMDDKPEDFIKKTFISAFYMTTGLVVALFLVLAKLEVLKGIMFLIIPIVFAMMFLYMLKLPELRISKKEKEISSEIIFAGRFIIIELE